MQPKVSIIIPVYNTEKYLKQCLETVCSQTLKEIQIICVDDGSSDGSVDIIKEFCEKDERVELYINKNESKGAGSARNLGLYHAKGEYLLILDSDDYFELDLARKTYNFAKESDLDVVLYDANYIDEKGTFLKKYSTLYKNELPDKKIFNVHDCYESFFQITPSMAWSKLWKRKFILENNISFQENTLADDTYFTYSALCVAKKISALPERLVNYRFVRVGNQTSNKDSDVYSSINCAKEIKKFLLEHNLYKELEYSYLRTTIGRCISHLRSFVSYKSYDKLYIAIKKFINEEIFSDDKWSECFDLGTEKHANNVAKQRLHDNIINFSNMSSDEYLYEQYREKVYVGAVFPNNLVEKTDRVILYGAGAVGRDFFFQNIKFNFCNIVAWADRNYEKIGFPVSSPEKINEINYDKIIIAIEKKEVANSIINDLIKFGIEKTKIFWQSPYCK